MVTGKASRSGLRLAAGVIQLNPLSQLLLRGTTPRSDSLRESVLGGPETLSDLFRLPKLQWQKMHRRPLIQDPLVLIQVLK